MSRCLSSISSCKHCLAGIKCPLIKDFFSYLWFKEIYYKIMKIKMMRKKVIFLKMLKVQKYNQKDNHIRIRRINVYEIRMRYFTGYRGSFFYSIRYKGIFWYFTICIGYIFPSLWLSRHLFYIITWDRGDYNSLLIKSPLWDTDR